MALNRHARAALRELAGGGVTNVTPDEIATLHELGKSYDSAAAMFAEAGVGLPVRVGNAVLWPMTCQGEDWWCRAGIWFAQEDRKARIRAFAYCLAHGRIPGALEHASRGDAARDIRRWSRTVTATVDQLDSACTLVYELQDGTSAETAADAALTVIEWLRATGHPKLQDVESVLEHIINPPPTEPPKPIDPPDPYSPRAYWKAHCVRLAALCGGLPDSYMLMPTHDAMALYTACIDAESARCGAKAGPPQEVSNTLKALRHEIVAIYKRRQETLGVK